MVTDKRQERDGERRGGTAEKLAGKRLGREEKKQIRRHMSDSFGPPVIYLSERFRPGLEQVSGLHRGWGCLQPSAPGRRRSS